jgi:hypothetical protein
LPGHSKCLGGPKMARGPRVGRPCSNAITLCGFLGIQRFGMISNRGLSLMVFVVFFIKKFFVV